MRPGVERRLGSSIGATQPPGGTSPSQIDGSGAPLDYFPAADVVFLDQASKSSRLTRTRRPTCSAGSSPRSIDYLDSGVIPIGPVEIVWAVWVSGSSARDEVASSRRDWWISIIARAICSQQSHCWAHSAPSGSSRAPMRRAVWAGPCAHRGVAVESRHGEHHG